jgi:hypothetical protein
MFMEKFMLIFHGANANDLSPAEMESQMGKWMAWVDKLNASGQYVSGEPLLPGGKLLTVKNKKGSDGPYTEGKEVVGGYFIINAGTMDEAVQISQDYPDFDYGGSVQVRQVMKMEM